MCFILSWHTDFVSVGWASCLLATAQFLSLIWRAHFVYTVENCYPFLAHFLFLFFPSTLYPAMHSQGDFIGAAAIAPANPCFPVVECWRRCVLDPVS